MADVLSVSITADTASLRAQLALAQAEVRAFGAETRSLANEMRTSGDAAKGGLQAALQESASHLAASKAQVAALTTELGLGRRAHEEHASAIHQHGAALTALHGGLESASHGFQHLLGILGVGFGAHELIHQFVELADKAVHLENVAASTGIPVEQFARISAAIQIVTGNADQSARVFQTLDKNIRDAIDKPKGHMAEQFEALKLSPDDLQNGIKDYEQFLLMLADRHQRFVTNSDRPDLGIAAFKTAIGRDYDNLASLFARGPEALAKLFEEGGARQGLDKHAIHDLDEAGQAIEKIKLSFTGLKVKIYEEFKTPIDETIASLDKFVQSTHGVVDAVSEIVSLRNAAGGAAVGGLVGAAIGGPLGAAAGAGIGGAVGLGTDIVRAQQSDAAAAGKAAPFSADVENFLKQVRETNELRGTMGLPLLSNDEMRAMRESQRVIAVPSVGAHTSPRENFAHFNYGNIKSGGGGWNEYANPEEGTKAIADWLVRSQEQHGTNTLAKIIERYSPESDNKGKHLPEAAAKATGLDLNQVIDVHDEAIRQKIVSAILRQEGAPANAFATSAAGGVGSPTRISVTSGVGGTPERAITPNYPKQEEDLKRVLKLLDEEMKLKEKDFALETVNAREDQAKIDDINKRKRAFEEEILVKKGLAITEAEGRSKGLITGDKTNVELQLKQSGIDARKQEIASEERDRTKALVEEESKRRIADREEAAGLARVENERAIGNLSISEARAQAEAIVQIHARKVADILATEKGLAQGKEVLIAQVEAREKEAAQKTSDDLAKIKDKADKEEFQRAHAINREIASTLSSAIVDQAWHKGGTIQEKINSVIQSQEKKLLETAGTKLLDASGVGGLIGGASDKLFGLIPGASGGAALTGSAAALTGSAGALTGAAGAITVAAGGQAVGGAASAAGGIASAGASAGTGGGIFGGLFSLFGLEGGGVLPSAQHGWTVPSFGGGGILAELHRNEMVLPAHLSKGVQGAIDGGGFGGGRTVNINVSAIDAHSSARFFQSNRGMIAKALHGAASDFNPHAPS